MLTPTPIPTAILLLLDSLLDEADDVEELSVCVFVPKVEVELLVAVLVGTELVAELDVSFLARMVKYGEETSANS